MMLGTTNIKYTNLIPNYNEFIHIFKLQTSYWI